MRGAAHTAHTKTDDTLDTGVRDHLGRADLRLHQRVSRRGQFDRDDCGDAGANAAAGGAVGGVLQLRGGVRVRDGGGADGGQRVRQPEPGDAVGDSGGPAGGDCVGPDYVVVGAADQFLARADWGIRGRGDGPRGLDEGNPAHVRRADYGAVAVDGAVYFLRAGDRHGFGVPPDGGGVLDLPFHQSGEDGRVFPQAAVDIGGAIQPVARVERRAEDHGIDHGRAGDVGIPEELRDPVVGDYGGINGDRAGDAERRMADCADDGREADAAAAAERALRGNRRG